jgi:hypothetical protein
VRLLPVEKRWPSAAALAFVAKRYPSMIFLESSFPERLGVCEPHVGYAVMSRSCVPAKRHFRAERPLELSNCRFILFKDLCNFNLEIIDEKINAALDIGFWLLLFQAWVPQSLILDYRIIHYWTHLYRLFDV